MRGRLVVLVVLASALAGCGLGAGDEQDGGAELRITRDFGQRAVASAERETVREGDTVMRFLQSEREVGLRHGGGFVQSIDGLAGAGAEGQRDWFYWVNGQEASVGAAERELHPGDVVQWDYRDWSGAMSIPGIVGAFPEPFISGFDGKRQPVRVECAEEAGAACDAVTERLEAAGVTASRGTLGTSGRGQVLRVFVGTWSDLRVIRSLHVLERGPEESGIFARPASEGARIELLDARGRVARTTGPGTGLVAATRLGEEDGVSFFVTGVDSGGLAAAARALERRTLRDAFAVAVTRDEVTKLPVVGGS